MATEPCLDNSKSHVHVSFDDGEMLDAGKVKMLDTVSSPFTWIDNLAVPVAVLDTSGNAVAANSRLTRISGIHTQQAVGLSPPSFLPDTAVEPLKEAIKDIVEKRAIFSTCYVTLASSSKPLTLRLTANSSNEYETTTVLCFVEEGEDPQPQVTTHEPLDRNFPMAVLDLHGQVSAWNGHLENLTGHRRDECLGRPFSNFIPDNKSKKKLEKTLSLIGREGAANRACLVKFAMSDGNTHDILINLSAARGHSNQVSGFYAILTDASDLGDQDTLDTERSSRSALHEERSPKDGAMDLQQFFDAANIAIIGVDASGYVTEWNEKIVEITGFAASEVLGESFVEGFIPIDIHPSVQEMLRNGMDGRTVSNFELIIHTREGHFCCLLVSSTPRRDNNNAITGVIMMAQDITGASEHDAALAEIANELRMLIDSANAPIFGIDRDGNVNEWNEKTTEVTGYTKDEAFDCSFLDAFTEPASRDTVQEMLDNALDGIETSNFEMEFRCKSGEIRNLLVNATSRRDTEGSVVGVFIIAQDVTEAFQRERAVAGMALELRQFIDTANAPIFGIDIDGNVNEWNRKTSEITGYSKEEAFDEPLVETFIAESMRDKVQEILDAALAGKETSNYELEFVSKTGEPIFLLVNATTRRDPENQVVGVVGVAQDVTEDRKHELALREMQYLRAAQEAKVETERNMTAYFAHELRNPLGAIDSALSAMPDNLPDSAKSLVSGMQLCSGFMSSIMNNLLDVRKMEEGKMKLCKSPISLSKLLNKVHKMLLPSVRPGLQFLKAIQTEGRDWVLGDGHRIQQIMVNVVTNAIKYTVTGSVTLKIGWEGSKVKFECIDTGPGIPKEEQETLFQRFVQRGGAPGTGLGLAIAKHLVDLTGGSIRFESDPTVKPGTSCLVLMALPLCDAPESVVEESTELIEEPISFLIIDDIKMNRMMLKRRILKGIAPNAIIREAATGEEALEICGKEKFDVIVVDQYMEEAGGELVGTDVVFAMRRMRVTSVIIGCSGNDMGTQFFEAGADRVWQKPMPSNSKIIQDLRSSLNRRAGNQRQSWIEHSTTSGGYE